LPESMFDRPPTNSTETSAPAPLVYEVAESERYRNPVELIVLAIQRALSKVTFHPDVNSAPEAKGLPIYTLSVKLRALEEMDPEKFTINSFEPEEWRVIKRYGLLRRVHLYDIGFLDLLQENLSPEGYNLAHDGGGYQSIVSMWSAAEAIVWFLSDFSGEGDYLTLVNGMGTLTDKLFEEFVRLAKTNRRRVDESDIYKLGWKLVSITAKGRGSQKRFHLEFDVIENLDLSYPPTRKNIVARTVILALPQPALKELQISGLEVEEKNRNDPWYYTPIWMFHGLLDSVTANPLFKLYMVYDKQWWEGLSDNPTGSFRIFTDQPLRQIYHFGLDQQQSLQSQENDTTECRMLLAYSDARYAEYWKKLDEQKLRGTNLYFHGRIRDSMTDGEREEFERTILSEYGTIEIVKQRAQKQLAVVHEKTDTLPDPILVLLKDWSTPPYYVGWHSWNMGVPQWKVAEKLVQPFLNNARIYICGEAFSTEQGWIEGALKSAERVLEKLGLRIEELDWVDTQMYQKQKILWL
jgi:flavin-dependent amine oxidoreductase